MKTLLNILSALIIGFWLAACEKKHDQQANNNIIYTCSMHPQIVSDKPGTCPICGMDLVPVTHGGNQEQELMLSETQIKLANISTQQIRIEEMGTSTLLTGRLVLNAEQTEVISSRIQGRIEKLYIKEIGERVNKGQLLYEIYSEQLLTLQNEYLLALGQVKDFKDNERYTSFLQGSEKKLLLLGMTKSQIVAIALSKKPDLRINIIAPTSGIIAEIAASDGQYVQEGGLLYRIEKLDKIWVEAELYPKEAQLVKIGSPIKIAINGFESEPVQGKVTFLSPEYRQGSEIVVLRGEIENSEGRFQPGMQANIILSGSSRKSLALPTDAVLRDQRGNHVWVETKEGVFRPRVVKTGLENFDKVEILEGLVENENVVVTGAYLLYSELVLKKGGNPMAVHNHSESVADTGSGTRKGEFAMTMDNSQKLISKEFQVQLSIVLNKYYKIKDALVNSNPSEASKASTSTKEAINKADITLLKEKVQNTWMKDLKEINKSLVELSNSKELGKQRAAFARLSESLYKSLKEFEVPDTAVYYQFCPMALENHGAYWLSNKKEIKNPFFGKKMFNCGETKEVLKSSK